MHNPASKRLETALILNLFYLLRNDFRNLYECVRNAFRILTAGLRHVRTSAAAATYKTCDSDKIQIVSGLSYDDEVITSWSKELYDGAAVNIQGSDDGEETEADSEESSEGDTDSSETTAEETTEAAETAAK